MGLTFLSIRNSNGMLWPETEPQTSIFRFEISLYLKRIGSTNQGRSVHIRTSAHGRTRRFARILFVRDDGVGEGGEMSVSGVVLVVVVRVVLVVVIVVVVVVVVAVAVVVVVIVIQYNTILYLTWVNTLS